MNWPVGTGWQGQRGRRRDGEPDAGRDRVRRAGLCALATSCPTASCRTRPASSSTRRSRRPRRRSPGPWRPWSPNTDFRVSITDPAGADAYPIASMTYLLLRKTYDDDPAKIDGAHQVHLVGGDGRPGQGRARSGYAPLPTALRPWIADAAGARSRSAVRRCGRLRQLVNPSVTTAGFTPARYPLAGGFFSVACEEAPPLRRYSANSSGSSLDRIPFIAVSISYSTRTNSTRTPSLVDVEHDVAGAPVSVFGPAHRPRIDEMDALHLSVPRLVGVPESQDVAGLRTGVTRHLRAERVRPILRPVDGIQRGRRVDADHCRPRDMPAERPEIDAGTASPPRYSLVAG